MAHEWIISRGGTHCEGCQRAFSAGEAFQAFLYEADEGYARRDFCAGCMPPPAPPWIGAWRAKRSEASGRPAALDRDALTAILTDLAENSDPQRVQFRFVLALLLWRKRFLRLEGTDDTGADEEVWTFVDPRTGDRHGVLRPHVDDAQLEQLSLQLEALVAGGKAEALAPADPTPQEPNS